MGIVYMLGFVVVQGVREMRSCERIDPWGNLSEPLHVIIIINIVVRFLLSFCELVII